VTRIAMSMAIGDYDRTRGLFDGRVNAQGIDLTVLSVRSAETFVRMIRHEEFDASEMSLAAFASLVAGGDDRFVGIPVFPSRMFRHRDIFVSEASGIKEPSQLAGARVGIRRYHMTALVWQRGMLSDEYAITPEQIRWVSAGIERSGSIPARVALRLPEGVEIEKVTDRTIDQMLLSGELDAGFLNFSPPSFRAGDPRIRRLFHDPRQVETEYWQRTGIFPIMHLVVVHRRVFDRAPWVAQSLMHAFEEAKDLAMRDLTHRTGTSPSVLPFFHLDAEVAHDLAGPELWPSGLSANRLVLETLLRYAAEQGVAERLVRVEELFAESAHELSGWEGTTETESRSESGRTWD
jgi:4,5-dihydroxyphthalate decarboxylase